jgi:hypothetical protein
MRREKTVEVWVPSTHCMGFICICQLPCAFPEFITEESAGELEAVAQCDMSLARISPTEHCFRVYGHAKSM